MSNDKHEARLERQRQRIHDYVNRQRFAELIKPPPDSRGDSKSRS